MKVSGLLRLLSIHFVSLLTKCGQNISSGWREHAQKPLKKCTKIGRFEVKFPTWRRQVGKNLMRRTGKRIYRRFRISNQIFGSIYRSRDIARSLDTTFAVFLAKITTLWMNISRTGFLLDIRFSQKIHRHFVLSFSIKKRWKFMARFPAKIQKVLKNTRFSTLWMNQIFFRKSGFVTFYSL